MRLTKLDINSLDFERVKKYFMELLSKVPPLKTKFLRANHFKLVTNEISNVSIVKNQTEKPVFIKDDYRDKELSTISRGISTSVL